MKVCVAPGVVEPDTLNGTVDDLFRQIEGQEIRDHRNGHDKQNPYLLQPRVRPDITSLDFFPWMTAQL